MKTALRMVAFASAILMMSPSAHAGNPFTDCKDDAQTFCKNVQPGQGRVKACLEDHYKEISDACYADLKSIAPPSATHPNIGPPGGDDPPPDDKQ